MKTGPPGREPSGSDFQGASALEALRPWLERFGGEGASGETEAAALTASALRALREALARPGRDRDGAYALLAADGLLTAAVEALARVPDPAEELRELIRVVSTMAPAGLERA